MANSLENSVKELIEYVKGEVIRLDLKEKEMFRKIGMGFNEKDWGLYNCITGRFWVLSDVLNRLENILEKDQEQETV